MVNLCTSLCCLPGLIVDMIFVFIFVMVANFTILCIHVCMRIVILTCHNHVFISPHIVVYLNSEELPQFIRNLLGCIHVHVVLMFMDTIKMLTASAFPAIGPALSRFKCLILITCLNLPWQCCVSRVVGRTSWLTIAKNTFLRSSCQLAEDQLLELRSALLQWLWSQYSQNPALISAEILAV